MAGYNYRRGMGNIAFYTYRRNIKPVSRFTAQYLRAADIPISQGSARRTAKKRHWEPVAAHHPSKYCNRANCYSLSTLRRVILQLHEQMEDLGRHYRRHLRGRRALVKSEYAVWAGTKRHRCITGWIAPGRDGTRRG